MIGIENILYDYDWWEGIYEDAKNIGLEITSFGLDRNRHATGQLTHNAEIVAINIKKEHGDETKTHKLADAFLSLFNKETDEEKRDELCEDFRKDLLEVYSIILQRESEWMAEDEQVDENIVINEYTFTENGKCFG